MKKPPKKFIRTAADRRAIDEGATWNTEHFDLFEEWCSEFAIQKQDRWSGKPLKLFDYQIDYWFKPLLSWRTAEGEYRFDRAFLTTGKKSGKTSSIAAYVSFKAFCFKNQNIMIASATIRQSETMFNIIKGFYEQHPELQQRWHVQNHLKEITDSVSGSKIKVAASADAKLSGPSLDLVVLDETAEFNSVAQKTFDRIAYAGAAKTNAQIISITTPSHELNTTAHRMYLKSQRLLSGDDDTDTATMPYIAGIPTEADWRDEGVWLKYLPHINKTVSLEYYRKQFRRAQSDPFEELSFRIYLCGQYCRNKNVFFDLSAWSKCKGTEEIGLKNRPACVSIDNGGAVDLLGISCLIPFDGKIFLKTKAAMTTTALHKKNKTGQTHFQVWADKGLIEVVEGDTITFERVLHLLEDFYSAYDVRALAYDPWQLSDLEGEYHKLKRLAINTPQIGKYLSPLILEFDRKIKEQTIVHEDDPVLNFCIENFRVKENRYGKLEFDKENSRSHIDLACSSVVALNALPEALKEKTVWSLPPVMSL